MGYLQSKYAGKGKGEGGLTKSVYVFFKRCHSYVKMHTRGKGGGGVKYLAYLSVPTLWMVPMSKTCITRDIRLLRFRDEYTLAYDKSQ